MTLINAPRVLLVDDDAFAFRVVKTLLEDAKSPISLEWVDSYEKGLGRLMSGGADVCLLDYQLGEHSGLELLKTLDERGVRTPVIMLTATNDHQTDLDAMRAGAVDYLVKGEFTAAVLERVVRYAAERARTLENLRESEERYALAVTGSNDGIWDWKTGQPRLFISQRWKQLLGLSADVDDTVDNFYALVHPDDRTRLQGAIDAHIAGRLPFLEVEARMLHKDANWHWVLVRGTAVRDSNGRATRIAGSLTDITSARNRDPLTGLANRALFLDRMEHALARGKRDPTYTFACLFLDCDRFKNVNDSLGHSAGDALLVSIARRLERCVRSVDTVARFGGDEFAVLLEDAREPDGPTRVADRIVDELAKGFMVGEREVFSGASVGIAMSRPIYSKPDELLRDADIAMYRAKSSGRGRVAVFDEQMHARALAVLQLEGELRHAVGSAQLEPFYQPIVTPQGGLKGFEALVRWRHPVRGMIMPDEFIPLAEETGVIAGIDRWVLKQACVQLVEWRKTHPDLTVSVNASHRQLDGPGAAQAVLMVLGETRLPPEALAVEVTESVVMDHPQAVANLTLLKEHGVKIVMDDFGTGYSSLASLHQLPFTGLKIDRSFIKRLGDDVASREVVRAVITLGRGLGLTIAAEGVETPGQLDILIGLGCELIQGFRFGTPKSAADTQRAFLTQK
ncbi:MAG: EAL domain-containing protein [Archangiaceae bacterium]|nr:EAL domain-containing protein [Archangiaceae bacterium]